MNSEIKRKNFAKNQSDACPSLFFIRLIKSSIELEVEKKKHEIFCSLWGAKKLKMKLDFVHQILIKAFFSSAAKRLFGKLLLYCQST